MDFFSQVGSQEILIILLLAVIVIGPAQIVEFGKSVGNITRKIKQASNELTKNVTAELEEEKKLKAESSKPLPKP